MNILVTGGAGFIGSHIVDQFVQEGHRVSVIDDLSTGKRKHVHREAVFYKLNVCRTRVEQVFFKRASRSGRAHGRSNERPEIHGGSHL
jgi:UDP-glucose 4-epimerase